MVRAQVSPGFPDLYVDNSVPGEVSRDILVPRIVSCSLTPLLWLLFCLVLLPPSPPSAASEIICQINPLHASPRPASASGRVLTMPIYSILMLPLYGWVTLGWSFNLSEIQSPQGN